MNSHTAFLKHFCICQCRSESYTKYYRLSLLEIRVFWKLTSGGPWSLGISLMRLQDGIVSPLPHTCSPDIDSYFYGLLVNETFYDSVSSLYLLPHHFIFLEDKIKFKPYLILFFQLLS